MYLYIGLGATWVVCVLGGIMYQKKSKAKKPSFQVFNISDRVVKQKKYQTALNERTKGILK